MWRKFTAEFLLEGGAVSKSVLEEHYRTEVWPDKENKLICYICPKGNYSKTVAICSSSNIYPFFLPKNLGLQHDVAADCFYSFLSFAKINGKNIYVFTMDALKSLNHILHFTPESQEEKDRLREMLTREDIASALSEAWYNDLPTEMEVYLVKSPPASIELLAMLLNNTPLVEENELIA
jgi:hypothetical protein